MKRWFQFTHPGKGATTLSEVEEEEEEVSIHAPWEGCDLDKRLTKPTRRVSIHAPWEGCDARIDQANANLSSFNSRTLGRVRPECGAVVEGLAAVSIHAPWEGCDSCPSR